MKKFVALSAHGKDQPGIVAALSKVLFEMGCNLEDSSMTLLKGDFAVLLLLSLPSGLSTQDLKKKMEPVAASLGLTSSLRELSPEEATQPPAAGLPHTLIVYGLDHPGIVYKVTQTAADLRVNITDLRTHVTQSGGKDLYSLVVEVDIPDEKTVVAFQAALEKLKKELKVEITLNPVELDEL
jgi:glycine cleavage system transcriptional repressor